MKHHNEFKVLYSFFSSAIAIIEIKRLGLPDGAALSDIYKWLVLENSTVAELHFKSMGKKHDDEHREFLEGEFQFNVRKGILSFNNRTWEVLAQAPDERSLEAISTFIAQRT